MSTNIHTQKFFFSKNWTHFSHYLKIGARFHKTVYAKNFCQTCVTILLKNFWNPTKLSALIFKSPVDQIHRFCVFSSTGAYVYVLDQSDFSFFSSRITIASERWRRHHSRPIRFQFLICEYKHTYTKLFFSKIEHISAIISKSLYDCTKRSSPKTFAKLVLLHYSIIFEIRPS